jgi:RNA polymerase-binding transcription factor
MKIEMHAKKSEKARAFEEFRKRLLDELKSYQDRVERARRELPVDTEPEDDAGLASRSTYREATMGKLERDVQTVIEIERALLRLDSGKYATCVACQERIADARLKALPWTRTCIQCAGRSGHFGGAMFRLNANPSY